MVRAWELLVEDSESNFDSDLEDMLIAAKANGIVDIEVDSLVDQLNGMGYAVTPDSLINSIENHEHAHEFIKTTTLNKIILKSHALDDETGQKWEDEEVDAEKLASKTAMKGVKDKQAKTRQAGKDIGA